MGNNGGGGDLVEFDHMVLTCLIMVVKYVSIRIYQYVFMCFLINFDNQQWFLLVYFLGYLISMSHEYEHDCLWPAI